MGKEKENKAGPATLTIAVASFIHQANTFTPFNFNSCKNFFFSYYLFSLQP